MSSGIWGMIIRGAVRACWWVFWFLFM